MLAHRVWEMSWQSCATLLNLMLIQRQYFVVIGNDDIAELWVNTHITDSLVSLSTITDITLNNHKCITSSAVVPKPDTTRDFIYWSNYSFFLLLLSERLIVTVMLSILCLVINILWGKKRSYYYYTNTTMSWTYIVEFSNMRGSWLFSFYNTSFTGMCMINHTLTLFCSNQGQWQSLWTWTPSQECCPLGRDTLGWDVIAAQGTRHTLTHTFTLKGNLA